MLRSWVCGLFASCLTACSSGDHPPPARTASGEPSGLDAPLPAWGLEVSGPCVGVEAETELVPIDLLAVIDDSGSMTNATSSGASKWSATKAALTQFLSHAPANMRFGLSLFPIPGDETSSCSASYYRDAALPIGDVKQVAAAVVARLDAVTPSGRTPTGPALAAALLSARAYGAEHRDRSVVVVLSTDGLPTTCDPTDAASLATLAEEALRSPGHVRTLLVASKALEGKDEAAFARIARAGGTGHALVLDPEADFKAQLQDALVETAARKIACDLKLPEPPSGRSLDYDSINVVIARAKERDAVPRVSGPEACAGSGWYYDVDPAQGAVSRLNVCPSVCQRIAGRPAAALRVELGCQTVVK